MFSMWHRKQVRYYRFNWPAAHSAIMPPFHQSGNGHRGLGKIDFRRGCVPPQCDTAQSPIFPSGRKSSDHRAPQLASRNALRSAIFPSCVPTSEFLSPTSRWLRAACAACDRSEAISVRQNPGPRHKVIPLGACLMPDCSANRPYGRPNLMVTSALFEPNGGPTGRIIA